MCHGCGKPPDKHRLVYYSVYAINRNSGRTESTMQATQSESDCLLLVIAMATGQAARAALQQGSRRPRARWWQPPQWSVGSQLSLSILRPFQQLRQLGDVDGYAPCLIPRHKIRSGPASRFIFVISASERAPVVVLHDEARAVVIGSSKVAGSGGRASATRLSTNHEHGLMNFLQAVHQNGRPRDERYEIFLINLDLFT